VLANPNIIFRSGWGVGLNELRTAGLDFYDIILNLLKNNFWYRQNVISEWFTKPAWSKTILVSQA